MRHNQEEIHRQETFTPVILSISYKSQSARDGARRATLSVTQENVILTIAVPVSRRGQSCEASNTVDATLKIGTDHRHFHVQIFAG